MRIVKFILLATVLAIIVSVSMIIGIGLAHEDATMPTVNTVATNNLSVTVDRINQDGTVTAIDNDTILFDNDTVWTPGQAQVVYLLLTNKEEIEVNYSLGVKFTDGAAAKNAAGEDVKLSDLLHFGVVDGVGGFYDDSADAIADVDASKTLSSGFSRVGAVASNEGIEILALVVYLPESVGELTGGEIELGLSLYVTSPLVKEEITPVVPNYFTGAVDAPAVDTNGATTESVTIGKDSKISAVLPEGVKLAEGTTELSLSVSGVAESEANVTANHRSEVVNAVDVHIDGIAEDNTVPMAIVLNGFLPIGLNSNNVKLYHVEDGVTNEMVLVDDPKNHNEFAYDPATGDVVITIASFSEIVLYGDTDAAWDGSVATAFAGGTGTEADPFIIATAEQLAYFRNEVDAGNTFEGKHVKLNANINLNDINFDPIGWGYDYDGFTEGGKTFNGTFDGNNKTIFGLYQNGWDLDPDKENYSTYTYSMAGGGLFASVVDATIKNLTISGADIVFECVDMGVVCGYAQGNCTFDNISIINCTIQNYNRYTGGVVGEVSPRYNADGTPVEYTLENGDVVKGGYHVFNNIKVDSTTTVSSLWGSFDTSLGGILGGKWDKNGAETKVTMKKCNVACTIDAFNDVTSAYQWYAYRRAGMLIGNTEQSADHKALADFLTCEDVYVYYGEWNNYHYCEFTNQSGSENASWQNNYPWVRVESGLSCNAYSNPRYGHPIINGTNVVDSIHSHQTGDDCMVSLPFAQLYGGGQGVYGATEHEGVSEGAYTVTYVNYGETIKVEFVGDNSEAHKYWDYSEYTYGDSTPIGWVDSNGNVLPESVPAGNTKHVVVYPKWGGEYTIRFMDAENNVLYYETFEEGKTHTLDTDAVDAARQALQNKVDASEKIIEIAWDTDLSTIDFKNAKSDITVKAVYNLSENSSITLTPVLNESGVTISYEVTDTTGSDDDVLIAIPPYVGTIPVETMSDSAFAGFDNLHAVTIPKTVTYIGANALASNWSNNVVTGDKGETMTIYYAGSYQEWLENVTLANGWSDGVSADTRVFFLNGTDSVDFEGYLQFVVDEVHDGWFSDGVVSGHFEYVNIVPDSFVSDYYKNCDCDVDGCKGNLRPDAKYWAAYVTTTE